MASLLYTDDLTCCICLNVFDDPVSLPLCGHSFCRKCVTNCLSTSSQCPQCNETVPTDEKYLPTNHILKSLAEKAAKMKIEHEKMQECLCPEHEEKLKLFCETDQQLACVICRDAEKHEGHKFKPIKEAAVSLRRELEKGVEKLFIDVLAIEGQARAQRDKMVPNHTNTETFSASEFSDGQHYWEIEVGDRAFWELGVRNHFLRCDGEKYSIYHGKVGRNLTFTGRLQKIGIYLNCSSNQVCFYDAANMKHVDTITSTGMLMPLSPYFNLGKNVGVREGDCNPLMVCWY